MVRTNLIKSRQKIPTRVTSAAALRYLDEKGPKPMGASNNRQSRQGIIKNVSICSYMANRSLGGLALRPSKVGSHSYPQSKNSLRVAQATRN
ncbi:hypothetical protein CRG98_041716 [Punica granatum]|uniref:Uncharacterized protein n=1 Tax=Punica granatum TaxID=22663 RepID=A0A2I0I1N3_PUNGR|nr:hypothetical protein CRG98_041716 [Punica granatum]